MGFYDGSRLLSKKDIAGDCPGIFLAVGNRTGGKTTFYNRYLVDKYLDTGRPFMLLFRYVYELENVADKFFDDIKGLFYPDWHMSSRVIGKGLYTELRLGHSEDGSDGQICGFAVCLNKYNAIKKNSHIFNAVDWILFDEFQPEDGRYLTDEMRAFMSIYTSVARGQGQMSRPVKVLLVSNPINILNPYYYRLGITKRLRKDTKYIRGEGFVFEQQFIEEAAEAQSSNAVVRALSDEKYKEYLTQLSYLSENNNFIRKPSGRGKYILTIHYCGEQYGMYHYPEDGLYYISDVSDDTWPVAVSIRKEDHSERTVLSNYIPGFLDRYRGEFSAGNFRFKTVKCRDVTLEMLTIR